MHICLDCGNSDMRAVVVAGGTIHECALCGARFGDRSTVQALEDADEAHERGVDAAVWPLVRSLERLPGLCVRDASAGDGALGTLPRIALGATSADALVQLENLAKSLLLGAQGLARHWVLEVEYQHQLCFVLKPRHGGGAVAAEAVRAANLDLGVLRRNLDRDVRLRWWRHAGGAPSG